jgi:histidinol-phosphatase
MSPDGGAPMSTRGNSRDRGDGAFDEYLAFACRLAEIAGRVILPHFRARLEVHNKAGAGAYDPVTIADRDAEKAIREEIALVYPTHGILGEEYGASDGSDRFTWVIDPIDGTRAFIIGQLHWGTLIALNDGAGPVLGVMSQPYTGEMFVGSRRGAELRRAGASPLRLKTRRCARLEDAMVCSTHPAMFQTRRERAAFDLVGSRARMVRFGGDCYSYCLLAAGFVDIVIESGLKPYDVQALIPIIEAAGGAITTWTGARADDGGAIVAAGDPTLHKAVLEILKWGAA